MEYELTIVAPEDLTVVDKIDIEKKMKDYGRIRKRLVDGVKRLAYAIDGKELGLFLYYDLELEQGQPQKLSSVLNIDDRVMRYLLIKKDTRR